ncbi:hypothetical protein [Anaerotruncus colihominis]
MLRASQSGRVSDPQVSPADIRAVVRINRTDIYSVLFPAFASRQHSQPFTRPIVPAVGSAPLWNLSFFDALDNPVYDWNTLITDYLSALE